MAVYDFDVTPERVAKFEMERIRVRQTKKPHGKRQLRHHEPVPSADDIMPRYELFVRWQNPRGYVVSELGEMSHTLALQLGFCSVGEPFEALDLEQAKSYARPMVADLQRSDEDTFVLLK